MLLEIQKKIKKLRLKSKDFVLCVELPILSKRKSLKIGTSKSNERARLGGKKKVNALKDGYLILIGMIKLFLKTRFISHFQISRYVNYNRYSKQNHLKTSVIYFLRGNIK